MKIVVMSSTLPLTVSVITVTSESGCLASTVDIVSANLSRGRVFLTIVVDIHGLTRVNQSIALLAVSLKSAGPLPGTRYCQTLGCVSSVVLPVGEGQLYLDSFLVAEMAGLFPSDIVKGVALDPPHLRDVCSLGRASPPFRTTLMPKYCCALRTRDRGSAAGEAQTYSTVSVYSHARSIGLVTRRPKRVYN